MIKDNRQERLYHVTVHKYKYGDNYVVWPTERSLESSLMIEQYRPLKNYFVSFPQHAELSEVCGKLRSHSEQELISAIDNLVKSWKK